MPEFERSAMLDPEAMSTANVEKPVEQLGGQLGDDGATPSINQTNADELPPPADPAQADRAAPPDTPDDRDETGDTLAENARMDAIRDELAEIQARADTAADGVDE